MEAMVNKTFLFDKIDIPKAPHIMDSQKEVSEEEIARRMYIAHQLEELGISTSKFDGDDEHEDEDEWKVRKLLEEGKEIPEELRQRILEKKKLNNGD
ncbi:MAG: hypothetical protein PUA77_07870 [Lachnospiraceae bacterium]|nr:hypothetical protein [Lachnospiraceae bacterium]